MKINRKTFYILFLSFFVFSIGNTKDATLSDIESINKYIKMDTSDYKRFYYLGTSKLDEDNLKSASEKCKCSFLIGGLSGNFMSNLAEKGLSKGTPVESMQNIANEIISMNSQKTRVLIIVPKENLWHFEGTIKALKDEKLENISGYIWLMDLNEKTDRDKKLEDRVKVVFGDNLIIKYGDYLFE